MTVVYAGNQAAPQPAAPIDPDFDEQPYTLDWTLWLDGDTISASAWDIPAGLTEPQVSSNTATTATVWLKADGIAEGREFVITNKITTAAGVKQSRSFSVQVGDR